MQHWNCPHPDCMSYARTVDDKIPMHPCVGNYGLMIPLVRMGEKAKVTINMREDYVGRENVFLDSRGQPVMSVTTTRDDGMDCTVYAPTASISQEGLGR
jgi:hypothetical protein